MKFYDLNSRVSPETMWAVCLPGLRAELSGGAPSDCFFLIRDKTQARLVHTLFSRYQLSM